MTVEAGEPQSADPPSLSGPVLHLLIPLHNEAANMQRLFASIRELAAEFAGRFRLHVILVDDGSTDDTCQEARRASLGLDVDVLRHEQRAGPGAAFGAALEHLAPRVRDDDWAVTLEGDNTSRQDLLKQMLVRTQEGYDVVLASPYMYGGGIRQTNAWRVLLSHVANLVVKELLGIHGILTMSSFYRLYRGETIRKLQETYGPRVIERPGFECMVELLLKLICLQSRISEVPMVLDASRRMGKSKMRVARTIFGYLTLWWPARRWRRAKVESGRSAISSRSPA